MLRKSSLIDAVQSADRHADADGKTRRVILMDGAYYIASHDETPAPAYTVIYSTDQRMKG